MKTSSKTSREPTTKPRLTPRPSKTSSMNSEMMLPRPRRLSLRLRTLWLKIQTTKV